MTMRQGLLLWATILAIMGLGLFLLLDDRANTLNELERTHEKVVVLERERQMDKARIEELSQTLAVESYYLGVIQAERDAILAFVKGLQPIASGGSGGGGSTVFTPAPLSPPIILTQPSLSTPGPTCRTNKQGKCIGKKR